MRLISVSMADKTNLPKPRHHLQGRPRETEPGLLPRTLPPKPLSGRAWASTVPHDTLHHLCIQGQLQELLWQNQHQEHPRQPKGHCLGFGSGTAWDLGDLKTTLREGKQYSNKHTKRMIQQEDFLHEKHDDFKFYTDQVSFGHEARDASLFLSCSRQFPWTYLQC